ncbi:MAG: glycosyltransferase family A protein [Methanomassiliicoccales archaeon]
MLGQSKESSVAKEELVSVIIPVYNRVDLLKRAIDSALAQTHDSLEIIVVDDASPEDVRSVLSYFHDPRINYVRCEANRGSAAARNEGIMLAKGRYVAFLDSDDEWRERKIEAQIKSLGNHGPGYGACYTESERFDDDSGRSIGFTSYGKEGYLVGDILYGTRFTLSSFIVEKSVLLELGGFDERLRLGQDWELYLRLALRTRFAYVKEPLTVYHLHKGQISNSYERNKNYVHSLRIILEKHRELFLKDRKALANLLNQIGYYEMSCGEKAEALRHIIASIAHNPWQKAAYLMVLRAALGWERSKAGQDAP